MSQKYALMFEGDKWLLFTFLQILIIAFWAQLSFTAFSLTF